MWAKRAYILTSWTKHNGKIVGRKKIIFCMIASSFRIVSDTSTRKSSGRVVRKPVNANPGLKVNRSSNFSSVKMLSNAYFLWSLRLLMLRTEEQKSVDRTPCWKATKLKSKFSLILCKLKGLQKQLKIYNFRTIVHFLKCILQVVDNDVFWQNALSYFKNDPLSWSF